MFPSWQSQASIYTYAVRLISFARGDFGPNCSYDKRISIHLLKIFGIPTYSLCWLYGAKKTLEVSEGSENNLLREHLQS